jgi:hypothetical protein
MRKLYGGGTYQRYMRFVSDHVVGHVPGGGVAHVVDRNAGGRCSACQNREVADPITKQFYELSSRAGNCFARSPTIARLFESAPGNFPRQEPAAPCLQLGGRVARVGLLSVVSWCPWSGHIAAGWNRPTCVDLPQALLTERQGQERRSESGGGRSRGRYQTAPKRHTSRAGSPTRATRHVASYLTFRHVGNRYPALP